MRTFSNIGVYAFGRMAKNHARVLGKGTHVFDAYPTSEMTDEARKLGYVFHDDADEFLDSGINSVIIATPSKYHLESFKKCIGWSKNILLEKPIASTLDEAQRIYTITNGNMNLTVGMNFVERANPVNQKLYEKLDEKTILKFTSERYGPTSPKNPDIIRDGVISDLAIHDIDTYLWLTGLKPNGVSTRSDYREYDGKEVEFMSHIDLFIDERVSASIDIGWEVPSKVRRTSLTTREGYFAADLIGQTIDIAKPFSGTYKNYKNLIRKTRKLQKTIRVKTKEPLKTMIRDFDYSIKNKTPTIATVEDGLATMKIIDAAQRSRGEIVRI